MVRCRFEEYRLALGVLVVVDRPPLLVAFIRKLDAVVGNNLVYLSILVPFRLSMPDEDDQPRLPHLEMYFRSCRILSGRLS